MFQGPPATTSQSRDPGVLRDKCVDGKETRVAAGDKFCSGGTDNLSEEERDIDTLQVWQLKAQ